MKYITTPKSPVSGPGPYKPRGTKKAEKGEKKREEKEEKEKESLKEVTEEKGERGFFLGICFLTKKNVNYPQSGVNHGCFQPVLILFTSLHSLQPTAIFSMLSMLGKHWCVDVLQCVVVNLSRHVSIDAYSRLCLDIRPRAASASCCKAA